MHPCNEIAQYMYSILIELNSLWGIRVNAKFTDLEGLESLSPVSPVCFFLSFFLFLLFLLFFFLLFRLPFVPLLLLHFISLICHLEIVPGGGGWGEGGNQWTHTHALTHACICTHTYMLLLVYLLGDTYKWAIFRSHFWQFILLCWCTTKLENKLLWLCNLMLFLVLIFVKKNNKLNLNPLWSISL